MPTQVSTKELLIHTVNGKVFKFNGVYMFMPTSQGFTFRYTGITTGRIRSAIFNHTSVAGYSLTDE